MYVCAAPKGTVVGPFGLKMGIDFAHLLYGIRYGFQGNYGSVCMYLLFQFQMNENQIEICKFEMHVKKFFVSNLI